MKLIFLTTAFVLVVFINLCSSQVLESKLNDLVEQLDDEEDITNHGLVMDITKTLLIDHLRIMTKRCLG